MLRREGNRYNAKVERLLLKCKNLVFKASVQGEIIVAKLILI